MFKKIVYLIFIINLFTGGVMATEFGEVANVVEIKDSSKTVKVLNENGPKVIGLGFKKGQGLEKHNTPTPAFLQVLEGEIEFSIEGKTYQLKAGSFYKIPAKIEHELKALTDSRAILVK